MRRKHGSPTGSRLRAIDELGPGGAWHQEEEPSHDPKQDPRLVPDEALTHPGFLAAYIAYGALLSVLAGRATAAVAAVDATLAVRVLAGLQLSLGVVAEAAYWSLMPVW